MQSLYAGNGRMDEATGRRRIAVVGAGIAGLSCAWALGAFHEVTLYERDGRLGGHSNTVEISAGGAPFPVDTGFIVYNEPAYPNLRSLFAHLGIQTTPSEMSFAVSLDHGRLEYAGTDLAGLFGQRRNLLRPRFWRMLAELLRFYRLAPAALDDIGDDVTLGAWLDANGPFRAMREDHLLPMAAAIWSCPAGMVEAYPARAFIRFCRNHGLLQVSGRPVWRTVSGGARRYVERLRRDFTGAIRLGQAVREVRPGRHGVAVTIENGDCEVYDDVVLACHGPEALALLPAAPDRLRHTLAAFRTTENLAVLHGDPSFMPKRRAVWSSWNLIGTADAAEPPCVTYWMNRLQNLPTRTPVFVTLNPARAPDAVWRSERYAHPVFDRATLVAQRRLWTMQGETGLWFAGAWLGSGFHEDGLQAGLAVAEAAGGIHRPWNLPNGLDRMPGPALMPRPITREAA